MKLLFFQWHSFLNRGIEQGLKELEISYNTFFYQFTDWEKDDAFLTQFEAYLRAGAYTDVLSVNFSPLISSVCEELGIRYTAWVYDSPLHIRDLSSLSNSCNRIFFFDRGQAEEYQKCGVNAFHLPLAVDETVFQAKTTDGERRKYRADVSLVGKLYQTEYSYYTAPLTEYLRGYLEGIVSAQGKLYGAYLMPELLTEELLAQMNEVYTEVFHGEFKMGRRELEFMLACETTGRERYMALALLSGHYDVALYSDDRDGRLKEIRYCGYADYYSQMPLAFSESKINLNISLKTIRTGIPLRVLDILGCGGFVLSNYQEELAEYFRLGEELVVYEDVEDMFYKAKYYIEHEDERRQIAVAGAERVKRDFTFRERLERMFG